MLGKILNKLSVWILILGLAVPWNLVYALPTGEQVVSGSATFDRNTENTLTVNQSSDQLIANYNSFSIGGNEAVHFLQPSSSSIALNRVVGIDPSTLLGTLTATGKIFLVNPNGIVFGQGCRLDTAGMVASTLNISDSDFLAGRYTFVGNGGAVVNQGYISTPGGYVALLGSSVSNSGIIEANLGSVVLASGSKTTLNMDPKGIISVVVDEAAISNNGKDDAVKNSGTIKANGGKVLLTAKTLDGVFKNAINNTGIIEAGKIDAKGGLVELTTNGSISSTGTIKAKDGNIKICADEKLSLGGIYEAAEMLFDPEMGIDIITDITQTGNASYVAEGDINVLANITITDDGDIILTADSNANGYGDLNITGAKLTTQGGDILLSGANVNLSGANVKSENGSGSVDVILTASKKISVSDSAIYNVVPTGDAYIALRSGTGMDIMGNSIIESNTGTRQYYSSLDPYINIYKNNILLYSLSGYISVVGGSGGAAQIKSLVGNGDSEIRIIKEGGVGGMLFYASVIDSKALTNGDGEVTIVNNMSSGALADNIDIYSTTINAESTGVAGDFDADIDITSKGFIRMNGSSVNSLVKGDADTEIYINPMMGSFIADNTNINAIVNGNGRAGITIYDDWSDPSSFGEIDLFGWEFNIFKTIGNPTGGDINILNHSNILAKSNNTNFKIDLDNLEDMNALAGVYMNAGGAINIAQNSTVRAIENKGVVGVGLLAMNGINMTGNSQIAAVTTAEGIAAVGLAALDLSDNKYFTQNINIEAASIVTASSPMGLAAVVGLAQDNITSNGVIYTDGGLGASGVALLAGNNIYANNITSLGKIDFVSVMVDLASLLFHFDDEGLDIDLPDTYSSGILLASLAGDISFGTLNADAVGLVALGFDSLYNGEYSFPEYEQGLKSDFFYFDYLDLYDVLPTGDGSILGGGTVNAKLLGVMARNNIGSKESPVNTNVDVLCGYSFGTGDIFIKEANDIELGLFVPISYTSEEYEGGEGEYYEGEYYPEEYDEYGFSAVVGVSLSANDGIVSVVSEGDMTVNSVIAPRGGVFLQSKTGSIYAGIGWNPFISEEEVSYLGDLGGDLMNKLLKSESPYYADLITDILAESMMDSPEGSHEYDYSFISPLVIGVDSEDIYLPFYRGPNILAGGKSYLSAPVGTIGVSSREEIKDPLMSGGIYGMVYPGVESVTGVEWSPDLDLRYGVPPGYILFQNANMDYYKEGYYESEPMQIWPEALATESLSFVNPLAVNVRALEGGKSALPEGFETEAALTLQIGAGSIPPIPTPVDQVNQIPNVWTRDLRAYYEVLNNYRFTSMEPVNPTSFFAYHPLVETDMSAFDSITLDAGAYDFISDSLNTKKPLSAYYGAK